MSAYDYLWLGIFLSIIVIGSIGTETVHKLWFKLVNPLQLRLEKWLEEQQEK